ncbi:hypothetical protein FisN_24Hu036 [Fistulifera solaris]|uniref:Uncharacterized protein n=1 Tax=Fistulifera solaris TaxID=1519565 RepID=A0A1Z5JF02_FISSO|nr:hypothetical protein FisN_24Hu036 [Fistulifera solaris]|eukprot:GAX12462.1 hypothetical protein FisN_24Hu036 [Fistulifera solaris]
MRQPERETNNTNHDEDKQGKQQLLLGLIPSHLRLPEQVPRWSIKEDLPTYQFLRDPCNLDELNAYTHPITIWRDNRTLTYFSPGRQYDLANKVERYLTLMFGSEGPILCIVGETDRSVAQTAAFFMALEKKKTGMSSSPSTFVIGTYFSHFDFRAAGIRFVKRVIETDPSRQMSLRDLTLSAKQSTVVATRSYPIRLHFSSCKFEDEGDALLDALQSRLSSSDEYIFDGSSGLSNHNLKRLVKLDTMQRLQLPCVNREVALLPFSAKVNFLECAISSSSLVEDDLPSLNIVNDKLSLTVYHDNESLPPDRLISFFRRMADFGHLTELQIQFRFGSGYEGTRVPVPEGVAHELSRVVLANKTC